MRVNKNTLVKKFEILYLHSEQMHINKLYRQQKAFSCPNSCTSISIKKSSTKKKKKNGHTTVNTSIQRNREPRHDCTSVKYLLWKQWKEIHALAYCKASKTRRKGRNFSLCLIRGIWEWQFKHIFRPIWLVGSWCEVKKPTHLYRES